MRQPNPFLLILKNPRSILIGVTVVAVVSVVGSFFFLHSRNVMEDQLKDKLRTAAAIAALEFDGFQVDRIHAPADMFKPEFRALVDQLNQIRDTVPNIRFAYVLRQTSDPTQLEFVVDADALKTKQELDTNGNGTVDPDEAASYPGDLYDIKDVPALQTEAFQHPAVDKEFTYDQWGTSISGYAPIRTRDGRIVATLGIDMDAHDYLQLSQSVFSPVAFMLLLLAGTLMAIYVIVYVSHRRIEALKELDSERTALMQITTHQLGAPLATFKWWMEIFREQEGGKSADSEMSIRMLEEGVTRMDAIMRSLTEAYEVFSGDISYRAEDASLKDLIEKVAAESVLLRQNRTIELVLNLEADIRKMKLDPKLVAAVVRELIDNAITYSRDHSTITVRAMQTLGRVEVQVQDQGHGIPKKDLPHIFERFTRGSNAMIYKPVGNGLGLYTARGIVRRAGGEMTIESEEGKGTMITFTLPVS